MSEFCHHFPSSPRYTMVVLVSGPATPATVPPATPATAPEVETERLCASMKSGKRSIASTAEYLVFMSRLLFANRGTCSNVLNHFLGQECGRLQRGRSVVVNSALYRKQQLMVGVHLSFMGRSNRATIQQQSG